MTAKELNQIHERFFKSRLYTPQHESKNPKTLAKKKLKQYLFGTLIWNKGTFVGNLRQTFKF